MTYATHIDLYQLTSLVPHWDAQRANKPVWMSFFSRRLPKGHTGQSARSYLVWCGLHRCLQVLSELHFDESRIKTLCNHPILGPALQARPQLVDQLRHWRFQGEVWAVEEGEVLWASPAVNIRGEPVDFDGIRPSAMPPYLQVYTDLLTAKLIETPLLSIINHMSMVATKAAHLTMAAKDRPILELGSRRTQINAAVDAAVAAYIGGVTGTSNIEANHLYGVPVIGTMDHFAVQSWEDQGQPIGETEKAFFKAFAKTYPESASLLVDTYDMFGEETGIRNAVRASQEVGVRLHGIRIDSQLSYETVNKARKLLDQLGATDTKIIVSGGVDEPLIRDLNEAPVDVFGVGERLVTSADAPVGVGAVGKLSWIDGQTSMKRAKGSGKATLPGPIQAFRSERGDRLTIVPSHLSTSHNHISFAWHNLSVEPDEQALIQKVWDTNEHPTPPHTLTWLEDARLHRAEGVHRYESNSLPNLHSSKPKVYIDQSMIKALEQKCVSRAK